MVKYSKKERKKRKQLHKELVGIYGKFGAKWRYSRYKIEQEWSWAKPKKK